MAPNWTLAEWSGWAWPLLANHLWQATIFALLALAAAALLRRAPARGRYLVWLIALFKFAVPSALLVFLVGGAGIDLPRLTHSVVQNSPGASAVPPLLSPVTTPPAAPLASVSKDDGARPSADTPPAPVTPSGIDFYTVLTCVWLAGCLLLLGCWMRRRRQLSAALRSARPLVRGREADALRRVQAWLGHRRRLRLVETTAVSEPGVWGVWRPLVVLPEGIADEMEDRELEAVLMHEVAHVERWDNLAGNCQRLLCCVFWFHPLVWMIDRRLLSEREQACDDAVVRLSGASEVYAASIAKVCRHCVGWRVAGLSGAAGYDLKKRIERILSDHAGGKLTAPQLSVVTLTAAAALLLTVAAGHVAGVRVGVRGVSVNADGADAPPDPRFEVGHHAPTPARVGAAARAGESAAAEQGRAEATQGAGQGVSGPQVTVEVYAEEQTVESHAQTLGDAAIRTPDLLPPPPNAPQEANPPGDMNPPRGADAPPQAAIVRAADVEYGDLRRFMGRYEVDPGRAENFVLDLTLEGGALWLKPSHAPRRRLVRLSETRFGDSYGDYRFTAILNDADRVVGLRLDSWGPNVTARKLALPAPSTSGRTVFRLKGYAGARVVAVAGSFNDWNQSQLLFTREGGEWVCRVNLPPGKHQYKFIVDGDWLVDPNNPRTVHDERGILNSLLNAD